MNLVQEMFRLNDLARLPEAIERIAGLLGRMQQQPGFIVAQLLQGVESRETLLVLHAWLDIAAWQKYQASPEKVAFTASRPPGLYDPVVCGMNWRSLEADSNRSRGLLRREVIPGLDVSLRRGQDTAGCQTFVYQDDLPQFRDCTLRLTETTSATDEIDPDAVVDETYRPLLFVAAEVVAEP